MVESDGCFYIVQPMPEDAPLVVKLGYAGDLKRRLQIYRILCPMANVVKTWPCPARYEHAAIEYAAAHRGCSALGGEVFRCESLSNLVEHLEGFFMLDIDTLDKMAGTVKRIGGPGGKRRSQVEVRKLIQAWEQGKYKPKSKRERQWLRERARQFREIA